MKAKLIKDHADYHLVDDKRFIISTTDKVMLSCTDKQKLSLKNCQAIERGYDLDELANELLYSKYPFHPSNDSGYWLDMYKAGFQKALELMGGKKFSEEDVRNIFAKTLENAPSMESHTRMISDEQYRHSVMDELYDKVIQSLQQTEWDVEVEIEKYGRCELCLKAGFWHCAHADTCGSAVEAERPKLDADGCLILKPLPKE